MLISTEGCDALREVRELLERQLFGPPAQGKFLIAHDLLEGLFSVGEILQAVPERLAPFPEYCPDHGEKYFLIDIKERFIVERYGDDC